jgi:hypothetical protein
MKLKATLICVCAGLVLAAIEIILFTPIFFGGNER